MLPVFSREIRKGQQNIEVVLDAFNRLGILRSIHLSKVLKRRHHQLA
jgi:hypothetical protein